MSPEQRPTATTTPDARPHAAQPGQSASRWAALGFIALAQLMIALDATIVNIALPSAQASLRFSAADRQWVVTARAAQGVFAALLAPTALALLAVTFTGPRERAKAFAVCGAVAGSGGAVGLVLGGVLAEHVSWRWCLYVNVPVAVVAAGGGWLFVTGGPTGGRRRIDAAGAVLATGGLVALVYGCSQAVRRGWTSAPVLGLLVLAVALLALFALLESKRDAPLLPLPIVLDRNRAGAYLAIFVAVASMFGLFLFLTYYLQVVLGYSPVQAGLAFLPMTAATFVGSGAIATRLLPRIAPRALMVPALLAASGGMALLTRLDADSGYPTVVLPAEILIGLAMSCVMVPAFSLATHRVEQRAAGVASAVANTAQQAGAAIGTAVLNTLATSATAGYLATHPRAPATQIHALVHGYSVAATGCTIALAAAALAAGVLINTPRPDRHPDPDPKPREAQTLVTGQPSRLARALPGGVGTRQASDAGCREQHHVSSRPSSSLTCTGRKDTSQRHIRVPPGR
jgi:MFS family permease